MDTSKRFLGITLGVALIVTIISFWYNRAFAYGIDGSLADWGVNVAAHNFIPTAGFGYDIDYTIENEANGTVLWVYIGPGYSYYNLFDAEALYFDNDGENIYIAIVTGLPKEGYNPPGNPVGMNWNYVFRPGDVFIDTNLGANGYEYALNITDSHLYQVSSTQSVASGYFATANPWAIGSGSDKGSVEFAYSGAIAPASGLFYKNSAYPLIPTNAHYILEAKIPIASLNLPSPYSIGSPYGVGIHWTMECGNDFIRWQGDVNPIPEPASLSLLGLGLLGLLGFRKRNVI